MKNIYLSTYCVAFTDYNLLNQCIRTFTDFPIGVEFATDWNTPLFDETLRLQIPVYSQTPITLHAPFVEICNQTGSPEEQLMLDKFQKAFQLYHLFHASSMVVHTHEGRFADTEKARQRSVEVLLNLYRHMKSLHINVTVENVGYPAANNVLFNEAQYIDLFHSLPQDMGCLIDIGHAMLNHWDIPALIHRLGPRIKSYHLNNNDGIHDSHLPLYDSEGCYSSSQIDEILKTIAQVTPDAHLILEYAPGNRISCEGIHNDIRRIIQVMS